MVSKAKDTVQCCDTISIHIVKKLSSDHHHHQSCPKLSTVRRNLFGIHDDESKRDYGQFLNEQLSDLASKSSQEWNFDFVKELPQPGKYVWQRVQGYEVPVWYAAVSRPSMKEASQVSEDERESTNRNSFHFANSKTSFIFTKEKAIGMEQPSKKPRLVQTTMKDYSRVKKRRYSHRLKLKQVQLYSCKLRNHHHNLSVPSRAVLV